MKALVIDPSRAYRQFLCKTLENYGYVNSEAASYQQALECVTTADYDVICMSMHLPDGDSQELCMRLRAMPGSVHTPIFLITSADTNETMERYITAGVTELFHKQDFVAFDSYIKLMVERANENFGRILYVEDTLSMAEVVLAQLKECNYQVVHFTTAEEALEQFSAQTFDLVLTDIVLAGAMSGNALIRAIRSNDDSEKNDVPIIAISSFSDTSRRIELFRSGVNDYVQKPVVQEELLARVKNIITSRQLYRELEIQKARLQQMAMNDQLTGLYNRHYLNDRMPKLISQSLRQNYPLSLTVIDIDFFKKINDSHGHLVGDDVLAAVAQHLTDLCRLEDVVARYGGEEFVVLLVNCDLDAAVEKSERIRVTLEELNPANIPVTASFGVTSLNEGDKDFASFFSRADTAVYQAKEQGRNRVVRID